MDRERTTLEKAIYGDYEIKDIFTNLERCREISSELKILDIIEPSGKNVGLLAELVYRINNMPELELIEIDEFNLTQPN
mgnify:CR=1 FL=1|tara:strand:+ start:78 stop:314 length:237 start_codon:yes stop_codon:yes gene_type:complete